MTKDEAIELIERLPYITTIQIANKKYRLEVLESSLNSNDPVDLVKLIKTDYARSNDKSARKLPTEKEREIAARAKQLLHTQLANALNIPVDEIEAYIKKHLAETW